MPRPLSAALVVAATVAGVAVAGTGAHFEPGKLIADCTPCHRGHGVPATPMLAAQGDELCLSCHEPGSVIGARRAELGMGPSAQPADVRSELHKPFTHHMVSCRECHDVHGVALHPGGNVDDLDVGVHRPSPKRGYAAEKDLCLSCHGSRGPRGSDLHDLSRLLDPTNLSYHPVIGPAAGHEVPSLLPPLSRGSLINCTDCHRNDDPNRAHGPHGSQYRGLLGARYDRTPGAPESPEAYRLCYSCHSREVVLDNDPFPLHRLHAVDERATCNECHDPHGAPGSRALLRFNEPATTTGVAPSTSTGRLEYISTAPGSGACFLTCHGVDHAPRTYGAEKLRIDALRGIRNLDPSSPLRPSSGADVKR